jgi:hypothetical protein
MALPCRESPTVHSIKPCCKSSEHFQNSLWHVALKHCVASLEHGVASL